MSFLNIQSKLINEYKGMWECSLVYKTLKVEVGGLLQLYHNIETAILKPSQNHETSQYSAFA